ncbi:MAG: hypothetical protein A9Z00_07335 [Thermobacillus sp. ZCTH02-B1]|uniref:YtpI family protein n=1 Tax=Thermobacillus sp. ZCTH02-B1 TaxID=1858795 RepID=UPI000B55E6B6|nr:YtpI family protein [Thermobacillus sp. ZCTH02-B1]OUM96140.1 MAG: hypothetical protein A9Z00_07335 [Thermobacillus sp. ZCTH02-B1]
MPIENVVLQWVLAIGVLATLGATVYYSLRYRRSADPKTRGILQARMNIVMGVMLILLALIQMLLFPGSTVRVIIGTVFLLLGLFNLFAGLRNHSVFRSMKQKDSEQG